MLNKLRLLTELLTPSDDLKLLIRINFERADRQGIKIFDHHVCRSLLF